MGKSHWITKFLDKYDVYAAPPPSFNINGSDKIGSSIGCLMTLITLIFMFLYSGIKSKQYFDKSNQLITLSAEPDAHLTDEDALHLTPRMPEMFDENAIKFKIAFAVDDMSSPSG
jgi:hypothetical protein